MARAPEIDWDETMLRQVPRPKPEKDTMSFSAEERAAMRRAAVTFRSLAAGYAEWAEEGGPKADHYRAEHDRLIAAAEWHEERGAEPETEHEAA